VALNTHPHLAPKLNKKEYSYTSIPTLDIHGLLQGDLYLLVPLPLKTYAVGGWYLPFVPGRSQIKMSIREPTIVKFFVGFFCPYREVSDSTLN
jgi:hypothetical protein